MARMKQVFDKRAGVAVRGLAAPFHGLMDEHTPQAVHDAGLEYLAGHRLFTEQGLLPGRMQVRGGSIGILDPRHPAKRGASDWTDRREGPPWFESVFSADAARQKWSSDIDYAHDQGGSFHLVVHPWMLHANEGELRVIKDVIAYATGKDAWIGTWDELADLKAND
jgi:hypothetical protein